MLTEALTFTREPLAESKGLNSDSIHAIFLTSASDIN